MDTIASNDLIKSLNGISGTSNDARINFINQSMTQLLADMVCVTDFAVHSITDERVKLGSDCFMYLNQFLIDTSSITLKDAILFGSITGFTFQLEEGGLRKLIILGSSGTPSFIGYKEVLVSYTAGYVLKTTIEILDNSALTGDTITVMNYVTGVETTYELVASSPTGDQILIGATATDTATNIAAKLEGTSVGAVATLPLDLDITSDTLTDAEATVTNFDIPFELKHAVALMVGGSLMEKDKKGNVASYKVGTKSVNFRSKADLETFEDIVKNYASTYRKANVIA